MTAYSVLYFFSKFFLPYILLKEHQNLIQRSEARTLHSMAKLWLLGHFL